MYNVVETEFLNKARIWGNTLLFSKDNAILFIEALKEKKINILGIDIFRKVGESIQPILDDSIDYSSSQTENSSNIWEEAIKYIQHKHQEDLIYEIVCE